jgi:hypothetical protein
MKKLSISVNPEFERNLSIFMKRRNLTRKAGAVRIAVQEAAQRESGGGEYDYRTWLVLGLKVPLRKTRRFRSEDELWSASR